jgi:hypothetical protein
MVRHTGEDLIDIKGIAVASVLAFQSSSIDSSEFDASESDRLSSDGDASFGQQIFYISVAETKSIVQPDGIADDIGRESVTLISIHEPILPISGS